jgi:hypothetical protein
MRLIDADALLHEIEEEEKKRIDKLFDTSCLKKKLNDFTDIGVYRLKKYINNLPKLGGTKWISIKDMLPKIGDKVFFITNFDEILHGEIYYTEKLLQEDWPTVPAFQVYGGKEKSELAVPVFSADDGEVYFISDNEVKYWMPAPELPEGINGRSE